MTTAAAPRLPSPWTPPYPVYRFTVDQYHQMIKAGILTEDDRVELLEGWVVHRMPRNPPHDGTVWLVQTALLPLLPREWILRVQSAITTADSEPEPDLVVARGPGLRYYEAHPQAKDIGLVVGISDTTQEEDREQKGRLYARARLPVYWIVNFPESRVDVYTDPKGGRSPAYRWRQVYAAPQALPPVLGGREVARVDLHDILV
jgi:hypothetical protein